MFHRHVYGRRKCTVQWGTEEYVSALVVTFQPHRCTRSDISFHCVLRVMADTDLSGCKWVGSVPPQCGYCCPRGILQGHSLCAQSCTSSLLQVLCCISHGPTLTLLCRNLRTRRTFFGSAVRSECCVYRAYMPRYMLLTECTSEQGHDFHWRRGGRISFTFTNRIFRMKKRKISSHHRCDKRKVDKHVEKKNTW